MSVESLEFECLVVGSGISGLSAALEALRADKSLCVVTKSSIKEGSSKYAQGGVAVSAGKDDKPVRHYNDSLAVGEGLCDEKALAVMTKEIGGRIQELIGWGARFDTNSDGTLDLSLEAGHSRRRVAHYKDATGAEIEDCLIRKVREYDYTMLEETSMTDLVVDAGVCTGAIVQTPGGPRQILADSTIIATGGCGQLFEKSVDSVVATGEAIGMAYLQGALIQDMEFIQFHPTAIDADTGERMLLVSESLRGEGARLVNSEGIEFMEEVDSRGALAPRDITARAIWTQIQSGKKTYIDARGLDFDFQERFPTVYENSMDCGIDPTCDLIPVTPSAHYCIGGIKTDIDCQTNIAGLYAVGEAACTGVHGANRLGSNSLAEALVFGARCGRKIAEKKAGLREGQEPRKKIVCPAQNSEDKGEVVDEIRKCMWKNASLIRTRKRLEAALGELDEIDDRTSTPPHSISALVCARLIVQAALERRETRGVHYRSDFPRKNPEYGKNTIQKNTK